MFGSLEIEHTIGVAENRKCELVAGDGAGLRQTEEDSGEEDGEDFGASLDVVGKGTQQGELGVQCPGSAEEHHRPRC